MAEDMENETYLDYKHRTTSGRYEVFTADAIKEFSKKQVRTLYNSVPLQAQQYGGEPSLLHKEVT